MNTLINFWKVIFVTLGGFLGWLVGEFKPTFPLIIVAIAFILYDAWTAFQLDKRVHEKYPEKTSREKAYFTSFALGKVVRKTIPERLVLIILGFMAEHWVFVNIYLPISYIVTGVILFEQIWSALENNSSCRDERESRLWKILQSVMVDKSARHFDVDLSELNKLSESGEVTDEMIEAARKRLADLEERKKNNE